MAIGDLLVKIRADTGQFMDDMRAAQHATYDSVRAIKALNATAGGDLNKLLNSTIRNTVSFAVNAGKAVIGDALQAIAFEENNQMALAALSEYRMKQEAITKLSTSRVQIGTKILTVEEQLAALEKRRMSSIDKGGAATLDQINWLNDIKRLQTDIQQSENGIAAARAKLADSTKAITDTERQRLTLKIQEYEEKINDITTYQIPKAQEKLAKSGYQPFAPNENQVDWEAMAAQIMAGGDKVVGIFADQMQGLTKDNIAEIKKKADEESRATMDVLSTMAIKSPFSRKEIVEGYGTLVRMGGISFEQGKEMMQQIVDIQSVTGKGNKGIQSMTLAVGKILATGRMNGDAVNQLVKTAGIPVWEILSASTNKTTAELQKMMRANKLSAEIVMPALQKYMKDFAGKAAEEAGTFVGLINSISDIRDAVYVDFFQPIGEALKRPFADLVDMLTGGPFRQSIKDAGKFVGESIAKGIDFIYRAVEKFRVLGNDDGNPFTRIMIILKDLGKEFNIDTSGLVKFTSTLERVFNWAFINKDALAETAKTIGDFFAGLVLVTSVATVLGKISMFITGFLASPIGLVAAAITGLYLAWKSNFMGIQDWVTKNGPAIQDFFVNLYTEISKIIKFLPSLDFSKFLENLKALGLIGDDVYNGIRKISEGIGKVTDSIFALGGETDFLDIFKNFDTGLGQILSGLFDNFLNPKTFGDISDRFWKFVSGIFNSAGFAGLMYSIGRLLGSTVDWLIETLGELLSATSLENLWSAITGMMAGIAAFIAGAFTKSLAGMGSNVTSYGNVIDTLMLWLLKIISTAVGAVLNLAVMIIYDLVVGLISLISNAFTNPPAPETKKLNKSGQELANTLLEESITGPFKESFSGGRAEAIVKSVWPWFKHLLFRLQLLVLDFQLSFGKAMLSAFKGMGNAIAKGFGQIISFGEDLNVRLGLPRQSEWAQRFKKDLDGIFIDGTNAAFDAGSANIVNNYNAQVAKLKKDIGADGLTLPPIPAPSYAGFGGTTTNTPEEGGGVTSEGMLDFVKKLRKAMQDSLNDPKLAREKILEVVWSTVPYVQRPSLETIMLSYKDIVGDQMTEWNAAGVFDLPLPIKLEPEFGLPDTGMDLGTLKTFTPEGMASFAETGLLSFGEAVELSLLEVVTENSSAAVQNGVLTGVSEGWVDGMTKLAGKLSKDGKIEETVAYSKVGLPQGEAITAGLKAGIAPAADAVIDLETAISKIPKESLPELTKGLDDWRLDMTTRVGPQIEGVRTSVVDPLAKSFDGVTSAVERLNDKILILAERLNGIKIPPQLQANSPTPFEMGLRGIGKATAALNKQKLPGIFGADASGINEAQRQRNINEGGAFNRSSNINLVVKVGEKEVAGVVATAVAGEVRKMVYRDTLRG
jgi:tape measure domain-containing protein